MNTKKALTHILLSITIVGIVNSAFTGTDCTAEGWDGCNCNGKLCQSCKQGYQYQLDQNTNHNRCCSYECGTCEDFTDGKICLTCVKTDQYYSPSQKKCINCPDACSKCHWDAGQAKVVCDACLKSDQYLDDGICKKCQDTCSQCQFDNVKKEVKCSKCYDGSYLAADFTCVSCQQNCAKCGFAQGSTIVQCTECKKDHFITVYKQCVRCPKEQCQVECPKDKCQEACTYDPNKYALSPVCIQCKKGENYYANPTDLVSYVKIQDGTCAACPQGCIECSFNVDLNEIKCLKCLNIQIQRENEQYSKNIQNKFYALHSTKCIECNIQKCGACSISNSQQPICTQCIQDYEALHHKLSNDAISYNNGSKDIPIIPYYVQSSSNSCIICPIKNCRVCEEQDGKPICTICYVRHYNKTPFDDCISCPNDCLRCNYQQGKDIKCYQCQDGYYRLNNKSCHKQVLFDLLLRENTYIIFIGMLLYTILIIGQ